MSSSSREIGRLLVTGVPGWLTDGLLQSLRESPPPGLRAACRRHDAAVKDRRNT